MCVMRKKGYSYYERIKCFKKHQAAWSKLIASDNIKHLRLLFFKQTLALGIESIFNNSDYFNFKHFLFLLKIYIWKRWFFFYFFFIQQHIETREVLRRGLNRVCDSHSNFVRLVIRITSTIASDNDNVFWLWTDLASMYSFVSTVAC